MYNILTKNKDGSAPQASQKSGNSIEVSKPQADGSGTNIPVEGRKHMTSFDGNWTLLDEPNIFQRSSVLQRSPPALSTQSLALKDVENMKESIEDGKNAAFQTEDNAVGMAPIFMLLKDEDQQLQVCKGVIASMKRATYKQKNISMEVKHGLCKLEEAIDILSMLKTKRWRDFRRDSQTESLTLVDTDVAPSPSTTNKRRASASPKDRQVEKKNKQEDKENSEGAGPDSEKKREKEEESEPWTVVRSNKKQSKKKKKANKETTEKQNKTGCSVD